MNIRYMNTQSTGLIQLDKLQIDPPGSPGTVNTKKDGKSGQYAVGVPTRGRGVFPKERGGVPWAGEASAVGIPERRLVPAFL